MLTTIPLDEGMSLVTSTPPQGFMPLTATQVQLSEYGFPSRPESGEALHLWTEAMSVPLVDESQNYDVVLSPLSSVASTTGGSSRATQGTYSSNWGGYDAKGTSTTYDGAAGIFSVPSVSNTGSCSVPYFSIWSGIGGGIGSSDLIQSGLIYNLGLVTDPTSADWSSFIEFLNSDENHGPTDLIGLAGKSWHVSTSDNVLTETTYSTSGLGTATFYLEDISTGEYASWNLTDANAYYDGSTAETIEESHYGYPFKGGTVNWEWVTQELASSGSWQALLSASSTDTFDGYYSSPGAMSSTNNTSYTMTATTSC